MDPSNEIIPDHQTFVKFVEPFVHYLVSHLSFPPSSVPVLSHPPTNHVSIGQLFIFSKVMKNGANPEVSLSPKNGT